MGVGHWVGLGNSAEAEQPSQKDPQASREPSEMALEEESGHLRRLVCLVCVRIKVKNCDKPSNQPATYLLSM